MRLIYLSPVPWVSFSQRPHRFVEWFRERTGGEVMWVDPYPTRFPNLHDLRRMSSSAVLSGPGLPSWLRCLRPRALPLEPLPGSGVLNGWLWQDMFSQLDDFSRQGATLLVAGKPSVMAIALLPRLKLAGSIYDAMDDFPAFYGGISRLAMRSRERSLVKKVDRVLVSSTELHTRWSRARAGVRLVRNGLDVSGLQAMERSRVEGGRKVLGYVGTIAQWFDWEWLAALAKVRPSDVVRLIGPVHGHVPSRLPGNVELQPACDYAAALRAMAQFDLGLIPFRRSPLTASVDPIKYYEYRALGVPVLSTDFGEMSLREGEEGTFISRALPDLAAMVELALRFKATPESLKQFARGNAWGARFDNAGII